jgi:hypothetical protein
MAQNGLPSSDSAAPPFATRDGKPTVNDGGSGKAAMPIQSPPQGGVSSQHDVDKSQTPKGGEVLKADPTGQSGNSGTVTGVGGEVPFKNLR